MAQIQLPKLYQTFARIRSAVAGESASSHHLRRQEAVWTSQTARASMGLDAGLMRLLCELRHREESKSPQGCGTNIAGGRRADLLARRARRLPSRGEQDKWLIESRKS